MVEAPDAEPPDLNEPGERFGRARQQPPMGGGEHDPVVRHQAGEGEVSALGRQDEVEREARELKLDADGRQQLRKQRSKAIAEALRQWLTRQRGQVPDGSATAKAIDYSLGRWAALTRYLEDGDLPIDNNHVENRIRPVALGAKTGSSPDLSERANVRPMS